MRSLFIKYFNSADRHEPFLVIILAYSIDIAFRYPDYELEFHHQLYSEDHSFTLRQHYNFSEVED